MFPIYYGLIIVGHPLHGIQSLHYLLVLPLLLGPLHHRLFDLTLDRYRLSHDLSIFLLSLSDCLECVCIGLGLDLGGLCLGVCDDGGLDQVGLGKNLVVLDLRLRVHLVDECDCLFLHLSGDSLALGLHFLYFLQFGGLLELRSLRLILTLLETLLLKVLERLVVVFDAQFVRLLLALKGVFELEDSLLLKGMRDVIWQLHVGYDN